MKLDNLVKNLAKEFGVRLIILNNDYIKENVYIFRNGIKSYVATENDFKKDFGKVTYDIIKEFGLYYKLENMIKFYINMKYKNEDAE